MTPSPDRSLRPVISIAGLSRRFGPRLALDNVSLDVTSGQVLGLVGANGAGKTTLIKHVLGLLKPQTGSVRVFGRDPVADPPGVLGRIGFLSEDRDLPMWMRVAELLRYSRAFYPRWDADYAEGLRRQFQLDPAARIKHLSRGELAKAGLLVALAHRPELLVLDEPSSGLDPLVRREMLEAIVRAVADEGRTVFFSSHLLDEIERVSDRIAMMDSGRIVLAGPLTEILESHHRLTLRFERPPGRPPAMAGALRVSGEGLEWTVLCNGARDEFAAAAKRLGAEIVAEEAASLDEIFLARVGRSASALATGEELK
ncbi:MAG: ABC transporter ATP-binding protein [Verrucomicrobia bacterium]|nr:ABC transporter ATP-binding protein [Verrucomicrobiota bacterium]